MKESEALIDHKSVQFILVIIIHLHIFDSEKLAIKNFGLFLPIF